MNEQESVAENDETKGSASIGELLGLTIDSSTGSSTKDKNRTAKQRSGNGNQKVDPGESGAADAADGDATERKTTSSGTTGRRSNASKSRSSRSKARGSASKTRTSTGSGKATRKATGSRRAGASQGGAKKKKATTASNRKASNTERRTAEQNAGNVDANAESKVTASTDKAATPDVAASGLSVQDEAATQPPPSGASKAVAAATPKPPPSDTPQTGAAEPTAQPAATSAPVANPAVRLPDLPGQVPATSTQAQAASAVAFDDQTNQMHVTGHPSRPPRRRVGELGGWRRGLLVGFIITALTLVTVATALYIERDKEPIYAARAEVFYDLEADRAFGFLREDRRLTTQLVLIDSPTVLAPVAANHNLTWEELAEKTSAELLDSSEIIVIEVEDADPLLAATVAGEIADEYLTHTIDEDALEELAANDEARVRLEAELRAKEGRLETVSRRLEEIEIDEDTGVPVDGQRLLAEHAGLLESVLALQAQVSAFEPILVDTQRATRLGEPYVLDEPVSPDLVRAGIGGLLLGGLLGVGTALLLTRQRRTSPS